MKKWEAKDINGNLVTEDDINWECVKDKASSLQLNNNGQIISLPNNAKYVQGKTASSVIGSGKIQIESRYVGIIKNNFKILVRVDEKTNNISIEMVDTEEDSI